METTGLNKIKEIFELQKKYKYKLYKSDYKERVTKLQKLAAAIRDNTEAIYAALYADFKKPSTETDITEVIPVIGELNDAIANLKDWMTPQSVGTPFPLIGSQSKIQYEPKGQVLIISPWNYPFYLAIGPMIGAIAAGNTMIIKPSEYSPNTSVLIQKIVESIFPIDEVAVVLGDASISTELLKLRHDHIFFTGSTPVGKVVMEAASKHLTPVTLELGGKSPVILDDFCDLKESIKKICWGKFINCGQTCVAPDYILLPRTKLEQFQTYMISTLQDMYGSSPDVWQNSVDFARIINNRHYNRLVSLMNDALQTGKLVVGGLTDEADRYISPTVILSPSLESTIMKEEIFGPLLPVILYDTIDEAIQFVNRREKPLALYIFSTREVIIQRVLAETSSGGTCINDVVIHLVNSNLPFGGIGDSGMGNYHGLHGFRTFSHERAVLRQSSPVNTIQLLYPPYGSPMKSLAKDVIKNLV
jgi:aldehyde dehydrogenase (NAD+)